MSKTNTAKDYQGNSLKKGDWVYFQITKKDKNFLLGEIVKIEKNVLTVVYDDLVDGESYWEIISDASILNKQGDIDNFVGDVLNNKELWVKSGVLNPRIKNKVKHIKGVVPWDEEDNRLGKASK